MIRLAAGTVLLALAGCNSEPAVQAVETSVAQAPANPMQPGLYAVGDGTQIYTRTRLAPDGTYVDLDESGAQVGGGTWQQRGELMCFDPEGKADEQQERCWTNGAPDPDGSFMTTRDDHSESYRVTPLAVD